VPVRTHTAVLVSLLSSSRLSSPRGHLKTTSINVKWQYKCVRPLLPKPSVKKKESEKRRRTKHDRPASVGFFLPVCVVVSERGSYATSSSKLSWLRSSRQHSKYAPRKRRTLSAMLPSILFKICPHPSFSFPMCLLFVSFLVGVRPSVEHRPKCSLSISRLLLHGPPCTAPAFSSKLQLQALSSARPEPPLPRPNGQCFASCTEVLTEKQCAAA
jgi:hypothetical protein